jgi:DNA-binding NarL/FixJ family response regulator
MHRAPNASLEYRSITRALFWDDTAAQRSIIQSIQSACPEAVVESASDLQDLIRRFETSHPDLVFLRVRSHGAGLPAITQLRRQCADVRIIAIGGRGDADPLARAVAAGACGFAVCEPMAGTHADGVRVDHEEVTNLNVASVELTLTSRETELLQGMTAGQSNPEIAKDLFVSEDTVKTHARRLYQKLGANDRAHAVALALRLRLIS